MAYEIKIDTGASIKSVEELQKQVDALKSSLDGLNKSTAEYAKIAKQLSDAQKQLSNAQKDAAKSMKEIGSSTDTAQKNIKKTGDESKKATDNFKIMRDEIKQLRSDFAGTTAGTQEYDNALLALSNKMRDFNDMNKMIRASAADTGQILGNITGTFKGVAGGFEAAAGALELFGVSTESLQKVEKRTMAIIKVVQGLAAAEDGLAKKLPYLLKQYHSINAALVKSLTTRKASKAATDAETASDVAQATASKTAANAELQQAAGAQTLAASETTATATTITLTGAVKALGAAIKANPLGLIIAAVGVLVSLLPSAIKGLKELFSAGSSKEPVSVLDELNQKLDELDRKAKIELEIKKIQAGEQSFVEEAEMELSHYKALLTELNETILTTQTEMLYKMATASKEEYKQLEADLDAFLKNAYDLKAEYSKIVLQLETETKVGLPQAKDDAAAQRKAAEEERRRNEAAASAYRSRSEELKKFVKELEKQTKTETQLENEAYEQQKKDLKDSLKRKIIDQKEYNKLSEQLAKNHTAKLKEIDDKAAAEAKKLSEELAKWQEGQAKATDPLGYEEERWNAEIENIKESYDKALISYDQYLKDIENSTNRHLANMDKLNAQQTSTNISNVNNNYNRQSAQVGADFDKLNALIDPKAKDAEIKAAELAMQKEQALYDLKKKNIEDQIKAQQELLSIQTKGSEEYEKTLTTITDLEGQMTLAETEHQTAVIEGEKKKQEAIENTKEQMKAQTKAYISAANDIIDKLSDLIGMYAEEARERSENEKLSIEARKAALEESKKYQIAQVIISTLQGIVGAWSTSIGELGPIAGPIAAAAMTALLTTTAAMNIAKIKSQQLGGSSNSLSGSSNANIGLPTFNTAEANINAERPVQDTRVYVLEEDITEKQDVAKTRVAESTF